MRQNSTFKTKTLINIFILFVLFFSLPSYGQMKYVVQVTNNIFTPQNLTISVGDTVEWQNLEGYHNVNVNQATYPSNPESFGNELGNDWTFSHIFNTAGDFDYRCDAHYTLGMVGKVTVEENNQTEFDLTVNFSAMNPHVGQTLWIAVIDKDTGVELERKSVTVDVEFTIMFSGLEKEHSYWVNFYADHNGNGMYDAPPADHAWSMELNNVQENSTLNFVHNTNFTDIMWKNKLTVHFMNMTPHIGEDFHLTVYDSSTGEEIQSIDTVADVDFIINIYGIVIGMSYNVDFYADHNGNGIYDAPTVDHAWRIELNNVMGDTTLMFTHNTNFTDISIKTGIDENLGDLVKMYPNPTTGKVTIKTGEFNTANLQFILYDVAGKQRISANKSFTDKFEVDLTHLVDGFYIVELRNGNKRKMMKLLKN